MYQIWDFVMNLNLIKHKKQTVLWLVPKFLSLSVCKVVYAYR